MELTISNDKKNLLFFQKNVFLHLGKRKPRKKKKLIEKKKPEKFLMFQKTELSYVSRNGNPKKLLLFQEVTFRVPAQKKLSERTYYIWGMELSRPPLHPQKKKLTKLFKIFKHPKRTF